MLDLIHVNPNSAEPIYKQLFDQIVRLIVSGKAHPGDELPSVRKLAEYFAVNPMTVSRAIGQLVDQGWLERRRGQPTRVAKQLAMQQTDNLLQKNLSILITDAKQLGISKTELLSLIDKNWEQE
ncbi:GntR family transcriptional regulator [Pseudoalteromonas sp. McH1-7]|uniref:GntR family transcriptional regulator n=1 Tax=Pseudoalteromonas peptidolytica F12-50-A1 TaxID=1315280 RepID=A0A8I0T525_9GAMM|nr:MULTISPECIES: GntR family transcriptional regulator [Pseudoalteromonas]MBE0346803.1 GntR family transcriptional regulator [Pseudoalteromonas peptidolytica F12-50-A1]MDW7549974.1 GntR family transcriptional regulator [Pseudoalteromonas peptidolytica]NLR13708.1 GntR family transcriptional regulator [Pseudoalteromonas peptidolytica]NUZ09513.1 GntR family transcriptional regulator [Pseudoalteromonas sp. McH1-7]RRS07104.1 GntR family transcriptional regulator [Pseudoalteromonas sp. J010]